MVGYGWGHITPAKMLMYLSSSPCTHLLDELPTDLIYYVIFPYLDYHSRVTANLLLHPEDRLRTPLRKGAVLEFSMKFSGSIVKKLVLKQNTATNPIARNRLTLKIWRTMRMFPELAQHCAKFRRVVIEKATDFINPNPDDATKVSAYTLKTLRGLCEHYLLLLETCYPYVGEVETPSGNWTAVNY